MSSSTANAAEPDLCVFLCGNVDLLIESARFSKSGCGNGVYFGSSRGTISFNNFQNYDQIVATPTRAIVLAAAKHGGAIDMRHIVIFSKTPRHAVAR